MRLDVYLVERGYFSTRQKAKEAIRRGFVRVNGVVVKKPSKDVRGNEVIEVECEERPRGYWKLKEIDEEFGLFSVYRDCRGELEEKKIEPNKKPKTESIKLNADALDIGSSAGGFLAYASERCKTVIGVEYSMEFLEQLKKVKDRAKNVEVILGDAFSIELRRQFDIILIDVTTDAINSVVLARKFYENLKEGGKMLIVLKGASEEEAKNLVEKAGLKVRRTVKLGEKREVYVLVDKIT